MNKTEKSTEELPYLRFPRGLLDKPEYRNVPDLSKLLYMCMLERLMKCRFYDEAEERGGWFVNYTNQEICSQFGCSPGKATRAMKGLEEAGLIHRKRIGLGMPDRIYPHTP